MFHKYYCYTKQGIITILTLRNHWSMLLMWQYTTMRVYGAWIKIYVLCSKHSSSGNVLYIIHRYFTTSRLECPHLWNSSIRAFLILHWQSYCHHTVWLCSSLGLPGEAALWHTTAPSRIPHNLSHKHSLPYNIAFCWFYWTMKLDLNLM